MAKYKAVYILLLYKYVNNVFILFQNANIHIMAVAACTYVANIVSTGCVTPYTEFALRAACQATDDHFVHLVCCVFFFKKVKSVMNTD